MTLSIKQINYTKFKNTNSTTMIKVLEVMPVSAVLWADDFGGGGGFL